MSELASIDKYVLRETFEIAKALAAEMKGELDKLTQELYDSKHLAASRKELLKEIHEVIVAEPLVCPVCGVSGCRNDGLCKLAEELGDD